MIEMIVAFVTMIAVYVMWAVRTMWLSFCLLWECGESGVM
jgi:hypothetical protein